METFRCRWSVSTSQRPSAPGDLRLFFINKKYGKKTWALITTICILSKKNLVNYKESKCIRYKLQVFYGLSLVMCTFRYIKTERRSLLKSQKMCFYVYIFKTEYTNWGGKISEDHIEFFDLMWYPTVAFFNFHYVSSHAGHYSSCFNSIYRDRKVCRQIKVQKKYYMQFFDENVVNNCKKNRFIKIIYKNAYWDLPHPRCLLVYNLILPNNWYTLMFQYQAERFTVRLILCIPDGKMFLDHFLII